MRAACCSAGVLGRHAHGAGQGHAGRLHLHQGAGEGLLREGDAGGEEEHRRGTRLDKDLIDSLLRAPI